MKSITLLVLNWNGVKITSNGIPLLDFCLPTFLTAAERYEGHAEVVLVDNCSSDESVAYVRERYPKVAICEVRDNKRLFSYNDVAETLDTDVIMLLNNDIYMEQDCLVNLTKYFGDGSVFSVCPDVFAWKNNAPSDDPDSRCLRVQYYKGRLFPVDIGGIIEHNLPEPFYGVGGAVAYDRKRFLDIGGLDTLYYPIYWEDSDIALASHSRGWKTVIAEDSKVYHLGSATMNLGNTNYESHTVVLTNEYSFIWKNIRSLKMRIQSIVYMPWHMMHYRYGGAKYYLKSLFNALCKMYATIKRRRSFSKRSRLDCDELFFNRDLTGGLKDYLWARVYCAANEPKKALPLVLSLDSKMGDQNEYIKRQLKSLAAEILMTLFQSKKYSEVTQLYKQLPQSLINIRGKYTTASSFRLIDEREKAIALYTEITADVTAEKDICALSFYHIAAYMYSGKDIAKVKDYSEKCLALMPEHNKCRELLEAVG